ncbi:MAG: SdpI family protein [Ruminiclostridium sp.]|nr:SdpI family protein [Ruminiclostridium sp.]
MEFWIFMLIMVLLIPALMIAFGREFMNGAPDNINSTFGYRTKRSMMNKETWKFAHIYFGKLWFICGLILLLPSVVVMLFVLEKDVNTVGTVGAIIVFVQMIPMFGTIIPTEKALKKNFDEYGRYR